MPRGAATVDPSELSESFSSASRGGSDIGGTDAGYISDHDELDDRSSGAGSQVPDSTSADGDDNEESSSGSAEVDVDSEGSLSLSQGTSAEAVTVASPLKRSKKIPQS